METVLEHGNTLLYFRQPLCTADRNAVDTDFPQLFQIKGLQCHSKTLLLSPIVNWETLGSESSKPKSIAFTVT